jgi:hypothetical protein
MRSVLALGLLIALGASADAATLHHSKSRHHVFLRHSQSFLGAYGTYAGSRPAVPYDDAPSYNDPSKFGGNEALPIGR